MKSLRLRNRSMFRVTVRTASLGSFLALAMYYLCCVQDMAVAQQLGFSSPGVGKWEGGSMIEAVSSRLSRQGYKSIVLHKDGRAAIVGTAVKGGRGFDVILDRHGQFHLKAVSSPVRR